MGDWARYRRETRQCSWAVGQTPFKAQQIAGHGEALFELPAFNRLAGPVTQLPAAVRSHAGEVAVTLVPSDAAEVGPEHQPTSRLLYGSKFQWAACKNKKTKYKEILVSLISSKEDVLSI